jgi:chromosomal replication initiation ATPase DnaA
MEARATITATDVMTIQAAYCIINKAEDEVSSMIGKRIRLIPQAEDLKNDVGTILKQDLKLRAVISSVTNLTWSQIESKHRYRPYVNARLMYCFFAKQQLSGITLKEIGNNLGQRDHTTVLHSLSTVNDLIAARDEAIIDLIEKINQKLLEI